MFTKAIALIAVLATAASAQNFFTYQGSLEDAGAPANGFYDMRFTLWDDVVVGAPDTQIGSTFTSPVTAVADGLFTVNIDLDDAAFQTPFIRYLQIEIRFAGDPAYTTLTPRQQVVYNPRSMYALNADQASSIELPYSGAGTPPVPSGSVFFINNTDTSGYAIGGSGPTWGVIGFAGDYTPFPPAPTPVGTWGVGEGTGTAGSSGDGSGVWGSTNNGNGGEFTVFNSNPGDALYAHTSGSGHAGIFRKTSGSGNTPALLVENNSTTGSAYGVHSIITSTNPGGNSTALRGQNNGEGGLGIGVWGSHEGSGWGVYGTSASGLAGFFVGDVQVIGTLSKSGGSFKIDHPQDPENMTLSHSFVESPDMKNIYDGVVILNKHGQAVVTLPSYFNALNQEFRYQLTTIGGYAPVYIATEIESSPNAQQFAIAGGTPGLKVSWQVTGIRHDAWANQNRIPTEEYKTNSEKGKYLNPDAFGQPKELGIGYIQSP